MQLLHTHATFLLSYNNVNFSEILWIFIQNFQYESTPGEQKINIKVIKCITTCK